MNTNDCKPHDLCEKPPGCCEEHELYVCAYHERLELGENATILNENWGWSSNPRLNTLAKVDEQYKRAVKLNYD